MKQYYLFFLLLVGSSVSNARSLDRMSPYEAQLTPTISFDEERTQINESAGATELFISISESAAVTADVIISFSNGDQSLYSIDQSIAFSSGGATTAAITFTPEDNAYPTTDYVVALQLVNINGATLGDIETHLVYVLDNESHAPEATNDLAMTFSNNITLNGGEIVTHDIDSQRLFVSNATNTAVEIIDFSDPTAMTVIASVTLDSFGEAVTSVSAYQGVIAVAVKGEAQSNGRIVFITTEGIVISDVEVGSLPDMVTFTSDGLKILVANEGEPNNDYTIDPEGSISIIDSTNGIENITQENVTTLNFNAFDALEETLKTNGVRIYGPNATVSQDLEPEYISVSTNNDLAYVSLQENNAYAIIDIANLEITAVIPFGFKDHSLPINAFDASNSIDFIHMSTWNILGMYQPDAIATYRINNVEYIITANEGDARDYDGFSEEKRIRELNLDPTVYPDAAVLQRNNILGRLQATTAMGDTDGDGDIDQVYSYGGRSFSIFNAATGNLIYDSGDKLERIIAEDPVYGNIFNTTNDENNFKNRSDDKGPEPEAVVLAAIGDQWYAFIGLERVGGVAVFNITDPTQPTFETYVNNRDTTTDLENPSGDLAPEGIIYIKPEDNATGMGLVVVANEVSGTVAVYTLGNDVLSTEEFNTATTAISIYPNPVVNGTLFFSKKTDYSVVDLLGRVLTSGEEATSVSLETLTDGIYIINLDDGSSQKVIKK